MLRGFAASTLFDPCTQNDNTLSLSKTSQFNAQKKILKDEQKAVFSILSVVLIISKKR